MLQVLWCLQHASYIDFDIMMQSLKNVLKYKIHYNNSNQIFWYCLLSMQWNVSSVIFWLVSKCRIQLICVKYVCCYLSSYYATRNIFHITILKCISRNSYKFSPILLIYYKHYFKMTRLDNNRELKWFSFIYIQTNNFSQHFVSCLY